MAVTLPCKLNVILFLWVCLAVSLISATRIKYCDSKANYAVQVSKVDISPNPLKGGVPAVFKIHATSGEALSESSVEISVSYYGVHVHSETIDLCQETSCPVSAGDFVLSHQQTLPKITPPGAYKLEMKIWNSNKELLTCITFPFRISLGSSVSDV